MTRFRRFLCDKLGWHVGGAQVWNDGFQSSSYCFHCKRRVLLDSQGNWFAASMQEVPDAERQSHE